MEKHFNNIAFLLPVMFYYAIEALIVGVFISIIWRLALSNFFGNIGYFQIIAIYWIIKMLLFNVFNLIAGIASAGSNMYMQRENDEDNSEYNENITE